MRLLTWNVNGILTLLGYHPWYTLKTYEAMLDTLGVDIACFQEPKITREKITKPMACMDKYDSFFSNYRRSTKGIHGTAVFTKRTTCTPWKAEEGITHVLVPSDTPDADRIGGYPRTASVDLSEADMKDLDSEGRTTVCDFGLFVLINLYCPNETNEERLEFKLSFNKLVDARVRALIKAGRQVIVVGDLNICAAAIDHCEPEVKAKEQGYSDFVEHPARKWLREFVGPMGVMVDVTRKLHPTREKMYTCWNTKIDARPSNYGTRIDYILVTPGLLPWLKDSDIQPDIMGSDHCPVYMDFHDEIEIEGRGTVKLWDEMNRGRTPDELPPPPKLACRNWPEYSGKQRLLSNFFGPRAAGISPSPSPGPSSLASSSHTQPSSSLATSSLLTVGSSGELSSGVPGGSRKGKEKERERAPDPVPAAAPKSKGKTQTTLSSFIKPPPKEGKKRKKDGDGKRKSEEVDEGTGSSRAKKKKSTGSASPVIYIDGSPSPPRSSSRSDSRPASGDEIERAVLEELNTESKAKWANIFAEKPAPKCIAHGEPAKMYTVNKAGINHGRRFWLCARPVGEGYQERGKPLLNPAMRCDYFEWDTVVVRPPGMDLGGGKKSK